MRHVTFLMTLLLFPSLVSADNDWPYPEDTPTIKPLSIGMASDRPIDIARFLLARGAAEVEINSQSTAIGFVSRMTGRPVSPSSAAWLCRSYPYRVGLAVP